MICMIALANLNYFRPHKSTYLFWLSNVSFMVTAAKYVAATILMTAELQMRAESSKVGRSVRDDGGQADRVGILLIFMDLVFLICSGITVVVMMHTIRKKIRDHEDQDEAMDSMPGELQQQQQQQQQRNSNDSLLKISPTNATTTGASLVMKVDDDTDDDNDDNDDSDDDFQTRRPSNLRPSRSTIHRTSLVHQAFSDGERHLNSKLRKMSERASIITQSRVRARARLKQSQAMRRVPAFSNLDAATIETVVDKMEYMRVREGEVLCRQGDVADRFFVCITGECEVLVGEKKVGRIRSLDYFGEGCFVPPSQLASNEAGGADVALRSATVKVCSELAGFLAISKEGFQRLGIFDDHVMQEIEDVRRARERANAVLLAQGGGVS